MGRLFWKFFFFISLAQLTTIFGVSAIFWFEHRASQNRIVEQDNVGPQSFQLDAAAATLQFGGPAALRTLLERTAGPQIYVYDAKAHELLGRQTPPRMQDLITSRANSDVPGIIRRITSPDAKTYLLVQALPRFDPDSDGDFEAGPHGGPGEPPGHHRRHRPGIPFMPVVAAMLASLVFAALLAWYFSTPIHLLRAAFEAVASGNLAVRLGPVMGRRKDELSDLGRNFDRMANHLGSLMDGQRRLLHDVSHELRSPLARLLAATDLARQQPHKVAGYLDRIELESTRMDKLVGELLTLSQLEAGVAGESEGTVNIDELVSDVVGDANFEAQTSGRSVAFSRHSGAFVTGRSELLHRAIENVVRNAIKHSPEHGVVVVDTWSSSDGRTVHIDVTDDGPGISEIELGKIFQPFFRGSQTKSSDGHGLGLAIARHILESHRGSISAFNRGKGGLRVEMVLPVRGAGVE